MKKAIFLMMICAGFALTSCEKEEIGGTATESMAGDWYVTCDAADEDGNVVPGFEDLFEFGRFHILTYNTAANTSDQLYVDDLGTLYDDEYYDIDFTFKVKTTSNISAMTFATNGTIANEVNEDHDVTITGGKILPNAGRQNNGSPADSIVFYVSFSNDEYAEHYGYAKYKISGIRYSGLEEND